MTDGEFLSPEYAKRRALYAEGELLVEFCTHKWKHGFDDDLGGEYIEFLAHRIFLLEQF